MIASSLRIGVHGDKMPEELTKVKFRFVSDQTPHLDSSSILSPCTHIYIHIYIQNKTKTPPNPHTQFIKQTIK